MNQPNAEEPQNELQFSLRGVLLLMAGIAVLSALLAAFTRDWTTSRIAVIAWRFVPLVAFAVPVSLLVWRRQMAIMAAGRVRLRLKPRRRWVRFAFWGGSSAIFAGALVWAGPRMTSACFPTLGVGLFMYMAAAEIFGTHCGLEFRESGLVWDATHFSPWSHVEAYDWRADGRLQIAVKNRRRKLVFPMTESQRNSLEEMLPPRL